MKPLLLRLRTLVAATALLGFLLPASAAGASAPVRAVIDGQELSFDVPPVIEQDRTLVPVRNILEPMGARIAWLPESRTVIATYRETDIRVVIDHDQALVSGRIVAMEVPARIVDGRTMVPLRFFAENLGFRVNWEAATRTIVMDSTAGVTASRDGQAASRAGRALAESARKYIGVPYAWGGTSPANGFDCSGFLFYLGKQAGVTLPRTSFEQFTAGVAVARPDLAAGDLVFFSTYAPGASHAGIYDGAGSFIHAGSSGTGVKITSLSNPYWAERYLGARRIVR